MHLPLSNIMSDDRELQFNKSIILLGLMDLLLNTDIASGCEYSKYNKNTMTDKYLIKKTRFFSVISLSLLVQRRPTLVSELCSGF